VNTIGAGAWSEPIKFYTASNPGVPQNFVSTSSTSFITLKWSSPANDGGCPIEGYRIMMEDQLQPGYKLVYDGSLSP
jgi:hypothetical protein